MALRGNVSPRVLRPDVQSCDPAMTPKGRSQMRVARRYPLLDNGGLICTDLPDPPLTLLFPLPAWRDPLESQVSGASD